MGSKAKAITGLLAATCICSVIALILSVVNVKDVFLPPSTKVGSSGGAQLSLGCCWVLDFAQVSGRLCCLSPTWGQSPAQTGLGLAEFGHCAWPHSTYSFFIPKHCRLQGLGMDPCPQHSG